MGPIAQSIRRPRSTSRSRIIKIRHRGRSLTNTGRNDGVIAASGALSNRHTLVDVTSPDNIELGDRGNLWIAFQSPIAFISSTQIRALCVLSLSLRQKQAGKSPQNGTGA